MMKICKWSLLLIISPVVLFSEILVESDFEDETMGDWVPKMSNECWEVDSDSTLEGFKNLKAVNLGIADSVYVYTNITFDLTSYTYEWKFMAKSSVSGLSSANTYWFWLAADRNDFESSDIKGYVVGINFNGETDDELSVWKVNGTADVTKIIDTDVTISNDALAIKVTRSSGGIWTLYYNKSNSFDSMSLGGTATDTSITTELTTSGPYFICTSSNSGKFRFDDCTISKNTGIITSPKVLSSDGSNVTVTVDEELSFDITAIVTESSFGGLFSTNKPSGSTFTEQTGDFPLSTTFSWTPDAVGSYSTIFTSTNEAGATDLIVNIEVEEIPEYDLWINEFHYDNDGSDVNQGVEICGKAGIDLSDYTIYIYEGSNGEVDTGKTKSLSGTIPNEDGSNFGAVWFDFSSLENDKEGIALVKDEPEEVLYFISYEGSFEAIDGPASGMTSEDVDISEGSEGSDYSIQLLGTGSSYEDFTWNYPALRSPGEINTGQTITGNGTLLIMQ